MNDTATSVRKPRYAYFDSAPTGGIYRTMWAIERQLSLASDYGEADLVTVLSALNPDLDESITADIEKLLDLGDAVDEASGISTAAYYAAIDEYVEHLRSLAHLVRGGRSTPTRQRHVLGATS